MEHYILLALIVFTFLVLIVWVSIAVNLLFEEKEPSIKYDEIQYVDDVFLKHTNEAQRIILNSKYGKLGGKNERH